METTRGLGCILKDWIAHFLSITAYSSRVLSVVELHLCVVTNRGWMLENDMHTESFWDLKAETLNLTLGSHQSWRTRRQMQAKDLIFDLSGANTQDFPFVWSDRGTTTSPPISLESELLAYK